MLTLPRGNNGFTLFEILIVVALIGLITATALPRFSLPKEAEKSAIEALIDRLQDDIAQADSPVIVQIDGNNVTLFEINLVEGETREYAQFAIPALTRFDFTADHAFHTLPELPAFVVEPNGQTTPVTIRHNGQTLRLSSLFQKLHWQMEDGQ